MRAEMEKII